MVPRPNLVTVFEGGSWDAVTSLGPQLKKGGCLGEDVNLNL